MAETLREDLEAAFEQAENASAPSPSPSPSPSPAPSPSPSPAPAPEPAPSPSPSPSPAPEPSAGTPKPPEGEKKEIPPAPKPDEGATPPPEPSPESKAPGSWSPEAREKWKDVPADIQKEIKRRESEISRAFTQSTEARKFANEFQKVVQPFMGFIAAENSTPLQAVHNMMQTAAVFRVGTAAQKVKVVADIINNFGIDLEMLDGHLSGQQLATNRPEEMVQRAVQQHLAPITSQLQQRQQQEAQQINQQLEGELAEFARTHEFYHDVRSLMGDLIEMSIRRDQPLSLTEAYDRAILLSEPVRRVLDQRKASEAARKAQAEADRALAAAGGVKNSSGAGAAKSTPPANMAGSLRDDILAAWDSKTQV